MSVATTQIPAEVQSAVSWWKKQIEGSGKLDVNTLVLFESQLFSLLMDKVIGHWFPSEPRRGQGHRSLTLDRMASRQDPVLRKAASSVGREDILFECFPKHLEQVTMWIDPGEVVIKLWWSYFQRGVEEVIYTTTTFSTKSPQKVLPPPKEPQTPQQTIQIQTQAQAQPFQPQMQQQHQAQLRPPTYHYQSPPVAYHQYHPHYSPGRYPFF